MKKDELVLHILSNKLNKWPRNPFIIELLSMDIQPPMRELLNSENFESFNRKLNEYLRKHDISIPHTKEISG